MSRRNPVPQARQANEAYYTPGWAVRPLIDHLPRWEIASWPAWECAAGAGHVACELRSAFATVRASDIAPPEQTLVPVERLDFLAAPCPDGRGRQAIVTNPPYGRGNRLALAFLERALAQASVHDGLVALLLPFEFDAVSSRSGLIAGHPAFAAKVTIGRRIRWVNLPQSKAQPMSHHSWFIWAYGARMRRLIGRAGVMVTV